jgi:hypothetical protein
MQRSRDQVPLYVALGCAAMAGGLIALVAVGHLAREILEIIMIISGAIFVAGLSAISRFLDQNKSAPLVQITFNEARLRDELKEEVADADFVNISPAEAWEPTTDKLLVQDPVLALAKVRIDLEREVRRVGIERKLLRPDQRLDLQRTLALLEERKELPDSVFVAIRDILPLCNAAIHGQEVSTNTAENVIEIANDVLRILQTTARPPQLLA